ncbi:MAG: hypothetical protein AABX08_02635 [Nanoarchaeota archaeon]
MDKVGVFYTIGFFLVLIVFFSFVAVVNRDFASVTDRLESDFGYEKIRNIEKSIQKGVKDIINLIGGVSVNTFENKTTFIETLANSSEPEFFRNLTSYKNYVESNYPFFLEISKFNQTLPLTIMPHNITYLHNRFGGADANVTWQQLNFRGFRVQISVNAPINENSCPNSGTSSSPYLNVEAFGTSGSCAVNGKTHVEIRDTLQSTLQATIDLVTASKTLVIFANEPPVGISVTVEGLDITRDRRTVVLPENVLNYNLTDFNIVKNGTIRIL